MSPFLYPKHLMTRLNNAIKFYTHTAIRNAFMLKIFRFILTSALLLICLSAKADTISQLFHHAGDPIGGNPNGNITIVEFFDYQCPHCMNMAPVISGIIKKNSNVRVVFKDYPILGPLSDFIARAALAAKMQGKYVEFNHALLSSHGYLTEDGVFQIAQDVGINVAKLKKDMHSEAVTAQLNATNALAGQLNVMSTPTFFIGPTNAKDKEHINYIPGGLSQTDMQSIINSIGKKL